MPSFKCMSAREAYCYIALGCTLVLLIRWVQSRPTQREIRPPYSCYGLPPLEATPLYTAEEASAFLNSPPFPYDQLVCLAPKLDSNGNLVERKRTDEPYNHRRNDQTVRWMQQVVDQRGVTGCRGERIEMAQSYSQQFEDVAILLAMGQQPCDSSSTVVEIGAVDGKDMSNSYFFERMFGWRSLLIEANPDNYAKLIRNRPSRLSTKVHAVICSPGEHRQFAKARATGSGGIVDSLDKRKIAKYGVDVENSVNVSCTDFPTLFATHGIASVELFSLDVEGAEELVLQHMDWSVPVRFFLVEMEAGLMYKEGTKAHRCRTLLATQGYYPAVWGRMGENVLFVRTRSDALPNEFNTT